MSKPTNHAAAELSTLLMLSPIVIASRVTEFWLSAAAPTARSKREASRMITEKLQAAGESAVAVHWTIAELAVQSAAAAWTGVIRDSRNDADTILTAALKPYSSRVSANRHRLSR